jgi:hypothetical protein
MACAVNIMMSWRESALHLRLDPPEGGPRLRLLPVDLRHALQVLLEQAAVPRRHRPDLPPFVYLLHCNKRRSIAKGRPGQAAVPRLHRAEMPAGIALLWIRENRRVSCVAALSNTMRGRQKAGKGLSCFWRMKTEWRSEAQRAFYILAP